MKKLALILSILALFGCGKGEETTTQPATHACAGNHNGTWTGQTVADSVTLTQDCGFTYHYTTCSSTGTYGSAPTAGGHGTVLVTVTSTTGSGCIGAGTFTYGWAMNDDATILAYSWDGVNAFVYTK
jgi:hypothetical protein